MSRFNVPSLEDGDENPEVAVPEQEGDLAGDSTVEAGLMDVQEAEVQAEATEKNIEGLDAEKEGLESFLISLEASLADGGLTAGEAMWAQRELAARVGKYGVDVQRAVSLENFGGASTRRQATISMENAVKEWLSKIWNAIKDQLKKLWAYLKNWYLRTLDTAPRLRARAEAIKKKAQGDIGSIASDKKTIEVGVLRQLHINAKVPTDLKAAATKAFETVAGALQDMSADEYEKGADVAIKLAEKVAGGESKVSELPGLKKVLSKFGATAKGSTVTDKRYGENYHVIKSEELLGGKMYVVKLAIEEKIDSLAKAADLSAGVGPILDTFAQKSKEVDSSGTFKTLERGEIENLCELVAQMCNTVQDFKKAWEARDKALDRVLKEGDRLEREVAKDKELKGAEQRELIGGIRVAANLMRASHRGGAPFISYALTTGKALLTVCERSVSAHKKD